MQTYSTELLFAEILARLAALEERREMARRWLIDELMNETPPTQTRH